MCRSSHSYKTSGGDDEDDDDDDGVCSIEAICDNRARGGVGVKVENVIPSCSTRKFACKFIVLELEF